MPKTETRSAVATPQSDSNTTKGKSHAEVLFDKIQTGRANALKVSNSFTAFRALVAEANKNGDCIINNGDGYYRPGSDDEEELKHYLYRELHRADEITDKVYAMKEAYYGRY